MGIGLYNLTAGINVKLSEWLGFYPQQRDSVNVFCLFVVQFDMLEMDRLERQLVNLPLLQDPSSYIPDTVDLTEDALAREYWLYCFEEALDGVGWHHSCNSKTNVVNICKIILKKWGKNTMTKIKSEPSIRL